MLSWMYPDACQLCGMPTEGGSLCRACLSKLPRVPRPICLYCGAPTDGNAMEADRCPACAARPHHMAFIRSAATFSPELMTLVHDLKYHGANHLAPALAPLLAELWDNTPQLRAYEDWVLVPIPITRAKLYSRGYNQAEELAHALARLRGGSPLLHPLYRRETGIESQTRLSAAMREKNAMRAYALRARYAKHRRALPPRLLLIDDVHTTGATLRACAWALKRCDRSVTVAALTLMRME